MRNESDRTERELEKYPAHLRSYPRQATVEALLVVKPKRELPPGNLDDLLSEIRGRMDRAVQGIFEGLPAEVEISDVNTFAPENVPFFPVVFGGRVLEDPVDVYAALEELRIGTPLDGLLYDVAGRAFRVHVLAHFQRDPRGDEEVWFQDRASSPY